MVDGGFVLLVSSGPGRGRRIELGAETVVGREDGDVDLDDPEVSRRHARFAYADGRLAVTDLDSTNGTIVNGARIDGMCELGAGDVVTLGDTHLEIVVAPSETPAPDAPQPLAASRPAGQMHDGSIASRRLTPTLISVAVVAADAVALAVYFAAR